MTTRESQGNWILYLGAERPRLDGKDSAQGLIEQARACGHPPSLVWVSCGDPLLAWLDQQGIAARILPQWLTSTRKIIQHAIAHPTHNAEFVAVQRDIASMQASWGMCFYSPWIPHQLFNLPSGGFINFHPGNLPALRGMEPETWAILLGMPTILGTVHQVTTEYDQGPILWETKPIIINDWDTPVSLLASVTATFLSEVPDFLTRYQQGRIIAKPQPRDHDHQLASFTRLRDLHRIDWQHNDHLQLTRLMRAFVGQRISLDLMAPINGDLHVVDNMELWEGEFPGQVGQYLGLYNNPGNPCHGWPMVRTLQGVALVRTTTPHARNILPPEPQQRQAELESLLKSAQEAVQVI